MSLHKRSRKYTYEGTRLLHHIFLLTPSTGTKNHQSLIVCINIPIYSYVIKILRSPPNEVGFGIHIRFRRQIA